jgi:hypothetical protein
MKMILWCSVAALLGVLIAKFLFGQVAAPLDLTRPIDDSAPTRIEIKGGVSGTWLLVRRANTSDPQRRGFDPSYTYLISDFKPMVKKLKNDKYLIQFTSELAEGLP